MKNLEEIKSALSTLSTNDYFRYLSVVEEGVQGAALKPLRVAILRSSTLETMGPILRLRLFLEGYKPEVLFGDYNQFVQEILTPSSQLYHFKPNVVVIMVGLEALLPDFIDDFARLPYSEWEKIIDSTARGLASLAGRVEENLSCQVIFQNVGLPNGAYWGICDAQSQEGQYALVHHFNRSLAREFQSKQGCFVWDFEALLRRIGSHSVYDAKAWYTARNPFKHSAYPEIVDDLMRYLLSALGQGKKCIVLDLDNTLWGGIAGEDGIEGIALGHDYPGNCYRDFQKQLLKLYHRGILLAINSKNDAEAALEIIDNHPDMVLRRKHFAAYRINWSDKASNLRVLAEDLNIGIDSMIFVDDNPRECELVRRQCPDCLVLCLPERPYLIPGVLNSVPGLERISITEEDTRRGEMYQAQLARGEFQIGFDNMEEYLKSLDLEVFIEPADSFSTPRIAQLTQRTNQMNLTTRRYTAAEITAMRSDRNCRVFSVSARDRFGDHGIVGVMILRLNDVNCLIDTFLLSCRVLGLKVEDSMIACAATVAKRENAPTLTGEYLPTAKNKVAADTYLNLGFTRVSDTLFEADLEERSFEKPVHIKLGTESVPSLSL
jgi:FkbH-like protein